MNNRPRTYFDRKTPLKCVGKAKGNGDCVKGSEIKSREVHAHRHMRAFRRRRGPIGFATASAPVAGVFWLNRICTKLGTK
ncbi:hypothetical protein L596_024122 [Steinernema carpocapsae]|uniref:Uncharacterized protein n=1 Tax=Steinernema carpocapsae TaxID=34508 RepID=A0A4U5MGH2_STECR|nr:hypothetical protein L596_024122 [Steinernema carpocapsae]